MKDLILQAKNGDRIAVTNIYNRTYKELYYYCCQICKNDFDVQDLVQETYLTAFEKLEQYRYDKNFKGWLHTIALHSYLNKRRSERPQLWSDEPINIPFEEELSCPEEYAENKELYRFLAKIISDKLTETQRLTVVMFYYDEMSVSEIAEVFECAVGTVKSRLYYSRKIIREELERNGYALGGNILVVVSSFNWNCGEFIAKTAADSSILASVLNSKKMSRRFSARSVRSFARRKIIAGAAAVVVAGGAAIANHAKNSDKPQTSAHEMPAADITEIPHTTVRTPMKTEQKTEEKTESAAEESTGVSQPGGDPVKYDFLNSLFTAMIPENYDVELASVYSYDGDVTGLDKTKSDNAKNKHTIFHTSSRSPARFYPDKFSGDVIIMFKGTDENQFADLNETLSNYFSDVSVGESAEIIIPVDTTNDPGGISELKGERTSFTAKSKGHEAAGTIIRCIHGKKPCIFIFVDCSGIRQAEYEAVISSIVFRYGDDSWKDNYQHFSGQ